MAVTKPPSDYEEDAARIDRDYIPPNATTEQEIGEALDAAGFPQSAQSHIEDWLTSEGEAWDVVDSRTDTADAIEREIRSGSGGTVSPDRARSMAENIEQEITQARSQAAQRVASDGTVRKANGASIGKIQNLEETVTSEGVGFTNTNTGNTTIISEFDRS